MRSKLIGQSPEYNMLYEILRKTERITQMAPHIGWNNGPTISPEQEIVNAFNTRIEEDGGVFEAEDCLVSRITVLRNLGLWDGASAAWFPHAYKESKFYAVKGGSGVDLGFTRAGTKRRKASTYVEQVPYNLLSRSEEFDNAVWIKTNSTIGTNSTVSPINTTTADSILETTTNGLHLVGQTYTKTAVATQYTLSCSIKPNGRNWVLVTVDSGANGVGKYFDLVNGVVGSTSPVGGSPWTLHSSSITAETNGFYRCTITFTTDALTGVASSIVTATGDLTSSYVGDITKGLYVWGTQLVLGSSARDYFKTTDRFNVPSLDYTGSTCPALSLEPARTNLLLQSEAFDNASWLKTNTTVTANAVAGPENLTTADNVLETTTNGLHYLGQVLTKAASSLKYTGSIYLKPVNGRNWVAVQCSDGVANGIGRWFNLGTGTAGTVNRVSGTGFTLDDFHIVPVANGFYRIDITVTSNTATGITLDIIFGASEGVESYIGDVTKGFSHYGAQLEQASYGTSYIPTTTATVSRIADSIPALLPKGTNQTLYSEDATNAVWVKGAVTVTANVINGPTGTLTADRFNETAVNQGHYIEQSITKSAAPLQYTFSIYAKVFNGRDWLRLDGYGPTGGGVRAYFNIGNGTLGSAATSYGTNNFISGGSTITSVGNGWYRCTVTFTTNTITTLLVSPQIVDADLGGAYLGDVTKGMYLWGAQLERGDVATTYVATTTAPVHNGTVIGQTQGSMYFEGSSFADNTNKYITLNNGAANDRVSILFSNTNTIVAQVLVGGVSQAAPSAGAFTSGTNYKICVSWTANNVFMYVNGVLAGVVDTSATIPTCNQLVLALNGTTNPFYGNLKSLVIYPTALTQAQAAALTA